MQHGLILGLDGGGVREDEDLGDEFAVHIGQGGVEFRQHDHALAHVLAAHAFQREGGGLPRRADGDGDPLALDGADVRGEELAERVRADEDGVAGVDHAAFDDAGDNGSDEGDGEGVVDVEFEWSLGVVVPVMGQDVEERADQVETFTRDVGNLEDGADALRDELAGGLDGFLVVLDENRDLAGAGGFEDARQLGDGLLQDLRRTDVDLGDNDHDWDIEREGNAKMFSAINVSFLGKNALSAVWLLTCSCQSSRCSQPPSIDSSLGCC